MLPHSGTQESIDRPRVTGYAHDLSCRTGERAVFCLDGPPSLDAPVPVKALNGETVGEVEIEPFHGVPSRPAVPWRDGFGLPPRAEFTPAETLQSGVYLLDGTIPFVYRWEGDAASVAVLLPSNTGTAFNRAGGRGLYEESGTPAADIVSFHRPLEPGMLMNGCMPFLHWFCDGNPYRDDTAYLIDSDLEDPRALHGIEVLVILGRSEYWTRAARECFDAFVDSGGRALLLCSEIMHWQVRLDLERHQLVCPKGRDNHSDPLLRASMWHDPSLEYPILPRTGCELWYGGSAAVDSGIGWGGMRIVRAESPLLRGSDLAEGDLIPLPDTTEWDGAPVWHGADGSIEVDFGTLEPWRYEVIAYNLVRPAVSKPPPGQPATSLWIVLRRTPRAGTVIHAGCMAWCGNRAVGSAAPKCERNRHIILNMLRALHEDAWLFSGGQLDLPHNQSDTAAST